MRSEFMKGLSVWFVLTLVGCADHSGGNDNDRAGAMVGKTGASSAAGGGMDEASGGVGGTGVQGGQSRLGGAGDQGGKSGAPDMGGQSGHSSVGGTGGQSVTADIGDRLVLDPASLVFFDLPINSIRYAVAGYDASARTCVSIIWDYSNTGHATTRQCDNFGPQFPYVIIETETDDPCDSWTYGSTDVTVESVSGCVEFVDVKYVVVEVTVTSDIFTGTIYASNQ
jgi:hypothetical protein